MNSHIAVHVPTGTYREGGAVEAPVEAALEEVRLLILIRQHTVDVSRDPLPDFDGLRVLVSDSRRTEAAEVTLELPVLRALEEVHLAVGAPLEGSVQVVRNTREAVGDGLRVAVIHLRTRHAPVLAALWVGIEWIVKGRLQRGVESFRWKLPKSQLYVYKHNGSPIHHDCVSH